MIDLHSHILPGLDDGARTLEDSLAIVSMPSATAATPHVREDYPTPVETMETAVARLRRALADADVRLELHTGGEIALDRLDLLDEDVLRRFGLAGGRHLLLETPYYGWPLDLAERLVRLYDAWGKPVFSPQEEEFGGLHQPLRYRGYWYDGWTTDGSGTWDNGPSRWYALPAAPAG